MICRLDDGEAKFRHPDQGSHGCPRDSFISSGYSVSFFRFSLFAYLLQEILLMILFHLPPYLTKRAIELVNQAFEVSAGSLQVFFVWT